MRPRAALVALIGLVVLPGYARLPAPAPPVEKVQPVQGYGYGARRMTMAEAEGIAGQFRAGARWCGTLDARYRADCLADQYNQIWAGMPRTGDFRTLREATRAADKQLNALARSSRDRAERPRAGGQASRPLVPVAAAALPQVNAAAQAVITEAATRLLRAADDDPALAGQFSLIANALESGKVLLRS